MRMNNKGTTLVEVIAGFMLLVVLMASFIRIIKLSSELTTAAADTKNMNLGFENAYYNGYNYKVDSKNAFRTSDTWTVRSSIEINEWERDTETGDFKEYHKGTDGKYALFPSTNTSLYHKEFTNTSLVKIENILDLTKSRLTVYRYLTQTIVTE